MRDLRQLLRDSLDLQTKHFTDDLRVFVTLRDSSPRWTRCHSRATKIVMSLRKFVLLSLLCGFNSEKLNYILVIIR
jgi:hypothetical protein